MDSYKANNSAVQLAANYRPVDYVGAITKGAQVGAELARVAQDIQNQRLDNEVKKTRMVFEMAESRAKVEGLQLDLQAKRIRERPERIAREESDMDRIRALTMQEKEAAIANQQLDQQAKNMELSRKNDILAIDQQIEALDIEAAATELAEPKTPVDTAPDMIVVEDSMIGNNTVIDVIKRPSKKEIKGSYVPVSIGPDNRPSPTFTPQKRMAESLNEWQENLHTMLKDKITEQEYSSLKNKLLSEDAIAAQLNNVDFASTKQIEDAVKTIKTDIRARLTPSTEQTKKTPTVSALTKEQENEVARLESLKDIHSRRERLERARFRRLSEKDQISIENSMRLERVKRDSMALTHQLGMARLSSAEKIAYMKVNGVDILGKPVAGTAQGSSIRDGRILVKSKENGTLGWLKPEAFDPTKHEKQ